MNADSPAATSGGSGRSSGCDDSLILGESYASADVVVLRRALERFFRNHRTQRRIELRERSIERAMVDVTAHARVAGRQRIALRVVRAEHVERMTLVALCGIDHVDLVVREIRLREAVLIDRALLLVAVIEREQEHR